MTDGTRQTSGRNARLASLDTLRGFDMFFIMGGEGLICAIASALGFHDFTSSFGHASWHGLHFMDLVFPLFLFLAGASFPFSCAKSRDCGLNDARIALRSLKRGMILVLLGLCYENLLALDFAHLRVWSVLGRIGVAWMVASWIYLVCGARTRIVIAVATLALVSAGTILITAPGAPAPVDPFSAEGNFGCWLDRVLTGGHTYMPLFDPEGFAGILPSIVTAMLGMFAGEIVRRGGSSADDGKALRLLAAGCACLVAGLALSLVVPINKALWSPSFTLVAGGISFIAFASFYWVVDVRKCRRWTPFFTVIGMNSITIYMAQSVIGFWHARDFLFGGLASLFPGDWKNVALQLGYIAVCWLFLYFLHRKGVYLKV